MTVLEIVGLIFSVLGTVIGKKARDAKLDAKVNEAVKRRLNDM